MADLCWDQLRSQGTATVQESLTLRQKFLSLTLSSGTLLDSGDRRIQRLSGSQKNKENAMAGVLDDQIGKRGWGALTQCRWKALRRGGRWVRLEGYVRSLHSWARENQISRTKGPSRQGKSGPGMCELWSGQVGKIRSRGYLQKGLSSGSQRRLWW